jgi:hypothetical protein
MKYYIVSPDGTMRIGKYAVTASPVNYYTKGATVIEVKPKGVYVDSGISLYAEQLEFVRNVTSDDDLAALGIYLSGTHTLDHGYSKAFGYARINVMDEAVVVAHDYVRVSAYQRSKVIARDKSMVESFDKSQVMAYGQAYVQSYDKTTIMAFDRCHVDAEDGSKVALFGKATAYGNVVTKEF